MTNKDLVVKAFTQLMQQKDITAFDSYWGNPFIQHNPQFPDGTEVPKVAVEGAFKNPQFSYELVRAIGEGDLVALHSRYVGFWTEPTVAFDIFRVQDGKLVEHWDCVQEEVTQTVNGHTMLDGATEIKDREKTQANKQVVQNFAKTILIEGKYDQLGQFLVGEGYIQHNPDLPDGVSGLGKALQELAQRGITFTIQKVHRVIAEGNFVLTQSEGLLGSKPYAYYDLFRVEDGKIAEHWDVLQEIPSTSANHNTMF